MIGSAPSARFTDGKEPGALRTIGEVANALAIRQHVLRYWEQQFPMLKPLKRSGGRRYYRPEDVALVERIDQLVNREGYTLRGARQEDLVRILDELDDRTERLEDEKQGLEEQRDELENSSNQAEEARKQTVEKERRLGILAGTVAAQGPGITMTIDDTKGTVEAHMLLDAVQELRAAGAEAIQVNGVRVVASTYLTDSGNSVSVVDLPSAGVQIRALPSALALTSRPSGRNRIAAIRPVWPVS